MHTTKIQVRFNDADALGHINNSVFFNYFDLGKTDYFNALLGDNYLEHPVDIIIAHIDVDFKTQAHLSEKLGVLTEISHIGNKSMTIRQEVVNLDNNEVKCEANTVMVGYDFNNKCTIPISDKWRAAIANK